MNWCGHQEGAKEEGGDWQKQEVMAVSLQWKKCTQGEGTGGLTVVGGRMSEARDLSFHPTPNPVAKVSWEDHHPALQAQRQKELKARQKMYR